MMAAGHNAFVCLCIFVCLAHLPLTHTYTQTHLFCPSQSSGYPASQPRQERITALCHVAVTSLSHISSCHSLQREKGRRRRWGESLAVSNRYFSLSLLFVWVFFFFVCVFYLSIFSVSFSVTRSLSSVVSQVYYVNIRCWTTPESLAAFTHIRLFPLGWIRIKQSWARHFWAVAADTIHRIFKQTYSIVAISIFITHCTVAVLLFNLRWQVLDHKMKSPACLQQREKRGCCVAVQSMDSIMVNVYVQYQAWLESRLK